MRPAETFVGQPIRSLQTMLRILAEDDPMLPSLIPDGIYGNQTRQAVYAFQRKFGIPATGVADQSTWDRILEEHTAARVRIGPAEALRLILNPNQVIRRGDSHPYILLVQSMLITLGNVYANPVVLSVTGILDDETSNALATFQRMNGLTETGELDKITWQNMALQYPLAVNLQETQNRIKR